MPRVQRGVGAIRPTLQRVQMKRALSIAGDVAVIAFLLVCVIAVEFFPVDEARRVG